MAVDPKYYLQQIQLLLRVPDHIAEKVRRSIRAANGIGTEENLEDDEQQASSSSSATNDAFMLEALCIRADESTDAKPDDYIFEFKSPVAGENQLERYPALLTNLPCIVETHKTHDKTTFYKSQDIGQVLQVFNSIEERNEMRIDSNKFQKDGFEHVNPSGLTPPTSMIVPRKFLRTRPQGQGKFKPEELTELINVITTSPLSEGLLVR